MSIVFIGCAANDSAIEYFDSINTTRANYVQQKWDNVLSEEFFKLFGDRFKGFSYSASGAFPIRCKRFFSHEIMLPTSNTRILSCVNVPLFKQILFVLKLKRELKKLIHVEGRWNVVIITGCLQYLYAEPAIKIATKYGCKVFSVVPDLPDFDMCTYRAPKWIVRKYTNLNLKYKYDFDGYICFSEHQMNYLNKAKPHIVMEGFCTINKTKKIPTKLVKDKFIVMYAGGIRKEYGIEALIHGFIEADLPDSELWLFGDGDYVKQLKDFRNTNIKYWGIKSKNEVLLYEQQASLLVNPRPTDEIFSYVSFPSKILEYMSSGTPVVTSHLGSIPEEYDGYLFYFNEITAKSISAKLKELYNSNELESFGIQAKKFVTENKNSQIQARRILNFVLSNSNLYKKDING